MDCKIETMQEKEIIIENLLAPPRGIVVLNPDFDVKILKIS